VLSFLKEAAREKRSWDIIVLDPPSFSNSKRARADFDIRRDYYEIISRCLYLQRPGGALWFSSNARGFGIDKDAFSGYTVKDMAGEVIDEDYKGRKVPSCYRFTK
jgi:23S rRNA G2069 N7-methylase RlmK/C1962 C5-methylase RlmI